MVLCLFGFDFLGYTWCCSGFYSWFCAQQSHQEGGSGDPMGFRGSKLGQLCIKVFALPVPVCFAQNPCPGGEPDQGPVPTLTPAASPREDEGTKVGPRVRVPGGFLVERLTGRTLPWMFDSAQDGCAHTWKQDPRCWHFPQPSLQPRLWPLAVIPVAQGSWAGLPCACTRSCLYGMCSPPSHVRPCQRGVPEAFTCTPPCGHTHSAWTGGSAQGSSGVPVCKGSWERWGEARLFLCRKDLQAGMRSPLSNLFQGPAVGVRAQPLKVPFGLCMGC